MKFFPLSALSLSLGLLLAPQVQAADSVAAAQSRIQALQSAGVAADNYNLAKAQCWVNAANTAQSENDRSGFAAQALGEAGQLLGALEADKNAAPRYGIPSNSSLRPDLAAKLKDLQAQAGAHCAAKNLACAEVQLARAAHGLERIGPKTAAPYLFVAQCALDEAQQQVAACAPAPKAPEPQKLTLDADGLFRFDRADLADLLPASRAKIDHFITEVKTWKTVSAITVTGHTDRLGTDAYNQQLSAARALSIKNYLITQGATADLVSAKSVGESSPVTTAAQCPSSLKPAALIACLQPDRRIEIEFQGSKD
jgi:outer membrane protein OmpA-like peptidoglycan-associated protein